MIVKRVKKVKKLKDLKRSSARLRWLGIFVLTFQLFNFLTCNAYAQKKAAAEEYMTKGEAVMLLSATDFMKKKIGELLSWTIGYDITKVSRVRLTPTINYIKVVPKKVPPDGRTILEITASIDDPGGLKNIVGVRADLSSIGRLPNTILVDNGLFGDVQREDGIYTLQTSVSPRVGLGSKDILVAVANRKGWLALAKTSLEVKRNPVIIEARVQPEKVLANGKTLVTITVKVDNPGRVEDVRSVVANLFGLGLPERVAFRNDGQGGDVLERDDIWTLQFTMPSAAAPGPYVIPIEVTNFAGGVATGSVATTVYK